MEIFIHKERYRTLNKVNKLIRKKFILHKRTERTKTQVREKYTRPW